MYSAVKKSFEIIISLIIHCITIPMGQKFTYTKLTVPLNSLENSRKNEVISLEASDRVIYITWVNWRCTCGCISRPTSKFSASLLDIMGKFKRIQPRPQKENCRPPQVWFIIGRNFQTPEGTMFICTSNSAQV
jgi:hypothetical protein